MFDAMRIQSIIKELLLILATLVLSCSRLGEWDNPEESAGLGTTESVSSTYPVFYCATPSHGADTKTFLDTEARMYWQSGDKIALFQSSTNERYIFAGEEGSTRSEFVKDDESVPGAPFSTNYALYPWSAGVASTVEGTITFSLPDTQPYAVKSFAQNANPMVAVTIDGSSHELYFQNLCSFLQLRIYGEATVRRIRFYGNNNEVLCGDATVTAAYGNDPSLALSGEGCKVLTIDCGEGGIILGASAGDYTPVWLVVPPITFTKGFTFEIERVNGVVSTKSTSKNVTLTRSHAQPMEAFRVEANPYDPVGGIPYIVAHRGCWLKEGNEFYINENTPAGIWMAAQYGYPAIECDVKYTSDKVMVVMHDPSINRTMRMASDYSSIPGTVNVSSCTFEELRTNYVIASTDPALRIPIPTLQEMLETCRDAGVVPMLHSSVVQSYELAHQIMGDNFIAFHDSEASVRRARDYSSCLILLDPLSGTAENTIQRLKNIGGWCGMSTMSYGMLDASYIRAVRDAGFEVQASCFPAPHEQRALTDGVTIELTDFLWYQTQGRKAINTLEENDLVLNEGDNFDWTVNAPEYAAVTMDLVFSGTLTISFCGKTYTLTHAEDTDTPEKFGIRLFKSDPKLNLKAVATSQIKSLKVNLYDCGRSGNNEDFDGQQDKGGDFNFGF